MFDLDKVIAEETPARADRRKKFTFTFDGETYTLPNEVDLLALSAAAQGEIALALRRLLTSADFAKLNNSSKPLTRPTLVVLLDAYYNHIVGLSSGESVASTSSSKSTARPSKQTSKRVTGSGSPK